MKKLVLLTLIPWLISGCGQTGTNYGAVKESSEEDMIKETAYVLYHSWDEVPATEYTEQEIIISEDGKNIWGVALIPDTDKEKVPLVICSHGLGGSYTSCMEYARVFASHGTAAYCFDFRGGGGTHSDGEITEMSLLTEADDLSCVISHALTWDFADPGKIILLGASQGAAASAVAAAEYHENINGLILCYPAFLIHDAVHEMFETLAEVPDSYFFHWLTLGRKYAEDVWDYDVYSVIGNYTKPVLLLHGDRDTVVPVSYSERAAVTYKDIDCHVIDGGGHGFHGPAFDQALERILAYLQKIDIWS